ncbi:transposable element Tcb1 transposase [Trichonephila clavipes]|nr:transposable element Tcb1 transposase [Trichonephila clavipes]
MTDLSKFEKGMIVGMRCAGCSVTEAAIYLGRARSTVSAVMTAYKKCGNVTSGKHNSGRKRKLTDRDKRVLTRIVARKRKQSLSQITSERGLGPLVTLHGKVKAALYVNILGDQVHPFVQTSFPGECPLYQEDNAPIHTAKIVQEWFAEHEGEVGHLDWRPQSPDLNIIEHLWGYLESKLRARFPPPSTISALETALHEEWLHIPLQVVHDLYASILRRIQSVIQSKGVQLPINKAFLLFHSSSLNCGGEDRWCRHLSCRSLTCLRFHNFHFLPSGRTRQQRESSVADFLLSELGRSGKQRFWVQMSSLLESLARGPRNSNTCLY